MTKIAMIHPGRYMQCQSFAITSENGTVIIDPGSGYFDTEVIAGLRAINVEPADVRAVLITHCHSDHAFGAVRWQARGARLMASQPTADAMRDCAPLIWCEHTELITPVIIDDILTDGQLLEIAGLQITCVATPGHTPGCMSYLQHDATCTTAFTGDMLMSGCRPGWAGVDFSGSALIASLRKMQQYNIDKVYPGHGVITGDINEWLETGIQAGCAGTWQLNHEPTSYDVPAT
jgi:hydroxyacylglutathione hydrolase